MIERFFKKLKIDWIANAAIKDVKPSQVNLVDNRKIPFKFAIIFLRLREYRRLETLQA
jgi:NADH dehydrogenase FAD-containing subunit